VLRRPLSSHLFHSLSPLAGSGDAASGVVGCPFDSSGSSGGPRFDTAPLPSSFGSAPTLSRAADLGEKIHSYYWRAMELREGHSVKWNEGLLSDSLKASKTAASFVIKKTVAKHSIEEGCRASSEEGPS